MLTNSKKENDFLMQALGNAGIGVWHVLVPEERFFVNKTTMLIIGYSGEKRTTSNGENWIEVKPDEGYQWLKELSSQISERNNSFSENIEIRHPKGHIVNIQVNGKVSAVDEQGIPTQITGTIYDYSNIGSTGQSLDYRYRIEKLVSGIASDFMEARFDCIDDTINRSLNKIGQFSQIDRSYLFLFHEEEDAEAEHMDNTHEWCAPGIQPEIENLQDLPCSIFPWWMKQLRKKQHIYIYDIRKMPEEASAEKEILEAQQIKSLLVVPILNKNTLIGFMGFDSVVKQKEWSESDIKLLETVAATIGNAITARRNHELLILEKEKAEESNRLKSAFLATMNHELRTPLHSILGFSDLIKSEKLTPEQIQNFAAKISESGTYLLQIVEDVITLSVGRKSEVKVRAEQLNGLDMLVQHKAFMNELIASRNRSKEIKLVLKPDKNFAEQTFISDKHKLTQIFSHLFKNALKFTQHGTIEYGISLENDLLSFYLKDEGIGIPKEQKEMIFDYFRQGDDSSQRRFQGIGIGLAICKNMVQILNGTLSLHSEPGQGSTFSVSIPVTMVSDLNEENPNKPALLIPDFSDYRFLVIDSDPNSLFLLKNLLATTHANILTSGTDMDVLNFMSENCFLDIIIINLKAEPEDSFRLIREMRTYCNKCSIIGLSAHSLIADRENAIKAGCIEVVSIPIETQLLFEAIQKGLKKRNYCV